VCVCLSAHPCIHAITVDTDANSYPHSQHVQTTPLDKDGCGLKGKPTINAVTNCDTPDRLATHGGLGSGQRQYGGPRVAVSLSSEQVPIVNRRQGEMERVRRQCQICVAVCNVAQTGTPHQRHGLQLSQQIRGSEPCNRGVHRHRVAAPAAAVSLPVERPGGERAGAARGA
jgi:hypothetical protein